jgi:hypothetical protein
LASNVRLAGPLRTADLFPLMLDHLGVAVPEGIDAKPPNTAVAG